MAIKISELQGKKILSEKGGKEIGVADDVVFDASKKKIAAILSGSSTGIENALAVAFKDIKSFGPDVIVVSSEEVLKKASDVVKIEEGKMIGTDLMTEKGQDLGELEDLSFEAKDGKIVEATAKDGQEEKQVKISEVMSSNDEMTLVKGNDEEPEEENPVVKKINEMKKSVTGK